MGAGAAPAHDGRPTGFARGDLPGPGRGRRAHGLTLLVRPSHGVYLHDHISQEDGMPQDLPRAEANRLYWETDTPVADIAERLDISRRALYDAIEPRPAGTACPDCGAPLVLRNRTAAERGEAECPECDATVSLEAARTGGEDNPEVERERVSSRVAPVPRPAAGSGPVLSGALLLGLAVGAAAGYLLRRR
jgi:hypothetical protein